MDFFEVVPRIFLSLACSGNQTMSKADTAKVLSLCFFEKAHHLTDLVLLTDFYNYTISH